MGTSTPWQGPGGSRWRAAGTRLARWKPDAPNADRRLEEIAGVHLRTLHEAVRADHSAFGLYDAACAAGERLAGAMEAMAEQRPQSPEAFLARLAREVARDGCTLADAAVRRAAAAAGREALERHPSQFDGGGGGGFAWDFLCDLYQLFFADVAAEFLRAAIAEHVKLAVPVLIAADPESRIADWVAEQLLKLVPSPCEEAEEAKALTEAVHTAQSVVEFAENPLLTLPELARQLVPEAVGKVLGLIVEEAVQDAEATGRGETAA